MTEKTPAKTMNRGGSHSKVFRMLLRLVVALGAGLVVLLMFVVAPLAFFALLLLTLVSEIYYVIVRMCVRKRQGAQRVEAAVIGLFLLPAILLLWLGLNSSGLLLALDFPEETHGTAPELSTFAGGVLLARHLIVATFAGSDSGAIIWFVALTLILYRGIKSCIRSTGSKQSVIDWIKSWPGWSRNASEPAETTVRTDLTATLLVPAVTGALSISDSVRRLSDMFVAGGSLAFSFDIISILVVSIVVGFALHAMTACSSVTDPLRGDVKVLKYPKMVRMASVGSSVLVLILWSVAAGHEPTSNLQIAASDLPEPSGRRVILTLVNRSTSTKLLTELHVESRLKIGMYCLSAKDEIPIVAEYQAAFSIFEPLTAVKLRSDKIRSFTPGIPAQVVVALEPDGTGYCGSPWKAKVRLLVVSDDGRRSPTPWFNLEEQVDREY